MRLRPARTRRCRFFRSGAVPKSDRGSDYDEDGGDTWKALSRRSRTRMSFESAGGTRKVPRKFVAITCRRRHLRNVDLNLLHALHALLEERHVTRAAKRWSGTHPQSITTA